MSGPNDEQRPGAQRSEGVTGAAHARYRPIHVPQEPQRRGPPIKTIFWIALLAVGGYGAYYGYCRYQVGSKVKALEKEADGLRQKLLPMGRVTREHIRAAVIGFAAGAQVEVDPGSIAPTIEVLDARNMHKLPTTAAAALSMVMSGTVKTQHKWLVGFKATFFAEHGVAKRIFEHERYTYMEDAQP